MNARIILITLIHTVSIINLTMLAFLYAHYTTAYDDTRTALVEIKAKYQEQKQELNRIKAALVRTKAVSSRPQGIHIPHLRALIDGTMQYLDVKDKAWNRLLLLTAMQESRAGAYIRQLKGPAQGIMQIEPATEKTALVWAGRHRPDLFNRLKALRCPAKLPMHEMQYNAAYCIGIAYTVYLMRKADPSNVDTLGLVKLYKRHFNTYKGKATVSGVMNTISSYVTSL